VRILRGELEGAAREFREPAPETDRHAADAHTHAATPPLPRTGRVTIINGLPTPTVGRDFAI
jgi:hypothetical protein